ncbi:MAG: SCO family protein [Verrucomicrobiales bacterium]|nr:SCO family protein [Verrucomicrobiales bacterium]
MTDEAQNETKELSRNQIIAWWGSIIGVCLVIAFGSIFVTRAYLERRNYEIENYRPPHVAKLETDLNAVNRDGTEVSLGQLRGKVYVAGYQYTDCPAGCLGMASIMKLLEEEFGEDPQFRLVSISVNPAGDTPEKMDAWVRKNGVDSDDWWFLTGDPEDIAKYMISQFMFFATEKVTDPALIPSIGEFSHDQRLALVDGDANVRGYYDVMSVERGELELQRLRMDLELVLNPQLKLSEIQEEFAIEPAE